MPMHRTGLNQLIIQAQSGQAQPPFQVLDASGTVLFEVTSEGVAAPGDSLGQIDATGFDGAPTLFAADAVSWDAGGGWHSFEYDDIEASEYIGAGPGTPTTLHIYEHINVEQEVTYRETQRTGYAESDDQTVYAEYVLKAAVHNDGTGRDQQLLLDNDGGGTINLHITDTTASIDVRAVAAQTGHLFRAMTPNGDAHMEIDGATALFKWTNAADQQTTVGAAGAASALPAQPTKYLKVKDSAGTVLVIPAYAAA